MQNQASWKDGGSNGRQTASFPLFAVAALAWLCAVGCSPAQSDEPNRPAVLRYQYRVVASYPHDRQAFTQGLVYEDGVLYEGTGLYGRSVLARRDLKTGKTLKIIHLPRRHFGEGITILGDKIFQLTWQNETGFVYRKDTFTLLKEFSYPTEGWGLTHDGERLIYSDGTPTLRFLDPNTLAVTGRVEVRDEGRPVEGINELEYIPCQAGNEAGDASSLPPTASGLVFANVWPTDEILAIDPKTGRVTGRLDLSALYPRPRNSEDVLNGIAWIPESNHLLVTGKLWPKIYEIEIEPQPSTNVSLLPATLPSITSVDIFPASKREDANVEPIQDITPSHGQSLHPQFPTWTAKSALARQSGGTTSLSSPPHTSHVNSFANPENGEHHMEASMADEPVIAVSVMPALTLIIAAFVAWVGYQQLHMTRQHFKWELFDPRLEHYKAATALIGKGAYHSRNFNDEWLVEFRSATLSGRFLLEEPAATLLKQIDSKSQEILRINDELNDEPDDKQRGELNEQRRELAKWFRDQYTKIDDVFKSSLELKKPTGKHSLFPWLQARRRRY